jgi:site-specific DNA-methyltransferase (adenine-specific)
MNIEKFSDGYAIQADSTEPGTIICVRQMLPEVPLIIADPPYGNVVEEKWDRYGGADTDFARWMLDWTKRWTEHILASGGAFYVWGGIGKPGFRPFMKYVPMVEEASHLELANLITWSKKRAYGVQNNYLFTREECAYFVKGSAKKPRTFHVPYLEAKRGYAGFNEKYPAKSENYRRSNIWSDITEIFRGKVHPTQKQQRLHEVMIEVHTNPGEWVADPFAGCGTTALAARKLGRKFLVVESDPKIFSDMVNRLRTL